MAVTTVFDPIRKRLVPATPEEGVRQAVIRYMIETLGVPPRLIGVEFSLAAIQPNNFKRVDIVAWHPGSGQLTPWLLVECKAPGVPIDDAVAFQAAGYLGRIPCAFVMLSNGKDTRYLERTVEGYSLIEALPYFPKG